MSDMERRTVIKTALAAGAAAAIPSTASASDKPHAGKSILITGASSGFGYLGALHYARLGAKVIASMRGLPRKEADELKAEAAKEKLDIHIIQIDVTSDEQVADGVEEAERIAGGPLDILINNAGVGYAGPIELQDMQATALIFDTNVYGPHRMARAVLPGMRKAKRGLIFNISSQLGRVIVPSAGHYSPTKFALEAMSEAMAYELVPHNVEVCVIQPGGYPTKVWVNRNQLASELKSRLTEDQAAAYPALVNSMGKEDGTRRSADPMDVPRAIAEIAAMPAGTRPLRRAVHPGMKPQEAINKVSAETQLAMLGNSPFGPWVKAVHD
ncbi:SDR family oxidoreductase [Sphingorhabdus sp.]|uniref:SDR family oxidoreductase n=1 Tax=Sphingorhabdus sp. TaxID=1902408 RepID=UPI0035AE2E6C